MPDEPDPIDELLAHFGYPRRQMTADCLARLGYPMAAQALAALSRPCSPLEVAAGEALDLADAQLARVRNGCTCYADTIATLGRVAALLRGGLGEE